MPRHVTRLGGGGDVYHGGKVLRRGVPPVDLLDLTGPLGARHLLARGYLPAQIDLKPAPYPAVQPWV
jgi:hypothetical protein